MFKNKFVEITILALTFISAIFAVVNVFTDWIPDIYAIAIMVCFLLMDSAWRNGYTDKS